MEHVLLLTALGAVLVGYRSLVQGLDWWLTTILVAGLVAAVCVAVDVVAPRLAVPVALVVGVAVLGWVFVPETLVGVVPTPSTVTGLGDLLSLAQVLVMEEAAPVAAARPIVLLLAASFALLVLVAELLLRWRHGPLVVGVLLLHVYAAPALVAGVTPELWQFLVPAAAWLVLLRVRSTAPVRGLAGVVPTLAVGGSALLVGVLLPPVMPDVTAVAKPFGEPPPQVFGRGINPMLQLGQNLRRNSTATAATYTTSLDDVPYLKVAVLRDFSGSTWRPASSRVGDRFESSTSIDDDISVEPATTDIAIDELRSTMLPVPYPAVDVEGLEGAWGWNRVGQTVSSRSATTEDQAYTVTSLDRQPTAEQMRALSSAVGPSLRSYLELPDDVPPIVVESAREAVAEAEAQGESAYDVALALQDYLREGDFTYSETAPVAEDYDGNGLDVLGRFLEERSGYCVHFSSAMAVMARLLDIPSRISVGYAPGRAVGTTDDGEVIYEVTSDDLHAWPELYFEGVGWVGFEPTPGVGSATAFEEPAAEVSDSSRDDVDDPARQSPDAAQRPDGSVSAAPQVDDAPAATRTAVVVLGAVLVLLLAPGLLRSLQRRRRLASSEPEQWWREVGARAADLGVAVPEAATPRGEAAALRPRTDADALDRLVGVVERSRYARPGTDLAADRADAARVVDGLAESSSRRRRWAARLLPRSLTRRR